MAFSVSDSLFANTSYALSKVGKVGIVLKSEQQQAVCHVYDGRDVFHWLPTGFGKSICYEVLPFLFDYKLGNVDTAMSETSIVLVVSPLMSLMIDLASLRSRRVCAGIMSGHKGVDKELLATDGDVLAGKFSLLFCAPEAIIGSQKWRELLLIPPLSVRVVAVAIDEAHCVSKWCESFRPMYAEVRALVPSGVPLLAATATVTRAVKCDVIGKLDMADMEHLVEWLRMHGSKADRVIVYCQSLDMCADLYARFLYSLCDASYQPPGARQVSDNRLFGMFHAMTPPHNEEVILESMKRGWSCSCGVCHHGTGYGGELYSHTPLWSPKKYQ